MHESFWRQTDWPLVFDWQPLPCSSLLVSSPWAILVLLLPHQLCLDISWTPLPLPPSTSELSSKLIPNVTCELSTHILYTLPLWRDSAAFCKNTFLRLNVRHSFSFTFLSAQRSLVAKPTSSTLQSKAQPFSLLGTYTSQLQIFSRQLHVNHLLSLHIQCHLSPN